MSESIHNEGIYQTGGSINADQLAIGRNASISKTINAAAQSLDQKGLQEIKEKLQALYEALETDGGSLKNAGEVMESTEVVAKELSKDKPNKLTLTGVLDGILGAVKSVTSITGAVNLLKKAIETLL
jgi:hypothetical protein